MLMNHADAQPQRILWGMKAYQTLGCAQTTGSRRKESGQDLREGCFTRAVFPKEPKDLSRVHCEVYPA